MDILHAGILGSGPTQGSTMVRRSVLLPASSLEIRGDRIISRRTRMHWETIKAVASFIEQNKEGHGKS